MSEKQRDFRENVRVSGIPFTWITNLSDEEIVDLYEQIKDDPSFASQNSLAEVSTMQNVTPHEIHIPTFNLKAEFKEGMCHCMRWFHKISATYRTWKEWELWKARQDEIRELKEEQETDRLIEAELLKTEENHLISKCSEALERSDYQEFFEYLCARADLLKSKDTEKFSLFVAGEVFGILSVCPVSICISFLRRYRLPYSAYVSIATEKAYCDKPDEEACEKIFSAAVSDYSQQGLLLKRISLFWINRKKYKLAEKYCELAISLNLKDDTKTGFVGRLKKIRRLIDDLNLPALTEDLWFESLAAYREAWVSGIDEKAFKYRADDKPAKAVNRLACRILFDLARSSRVKKDDCKRIFGNDLYPGVRLFVNSLPVVRDIKFGIYKDRWFLEASFRFFDSIPNVTEVFWENISAICSMATTTFEGEEIPYVSPDYKHLMKSGRSVQYKMIRNAILLSAIPVSEESEPVTGDIGILRSELNIKNSLEDTLSIFKQLYKKYHTCLKQLHRCDYQKRRSQKRMKKS